MGLAITAYRKFKTIDVLSNATAASVDPVTRQTVDTHVQFRLNSDFLGHADGLTHGAMYEYEKAEKVFSVGYHGYDRWREALARMAGYPLTRYKASLFSRPAFSHAVACAEGSTGPFSELIDFTDCDGVIGPVLAAKLADDFAQWDELAKTVDRPAFYEAYCSLRRGMEIAADGGALRFL